MWNSNALSTYRTELSAGDRYTVSDEICAMQLTPSNSLIFKLGPLVTLPKSTQLEVCGEGFNDRTLKVRCNGSFYFVFIQDLEAQRKPMGRSAHAGM